MGTVRTSSVGPATRPVSIPADVDSAEKARGVVELPLHIRWSGPPKTYDLSNKRDRALVYEQVLAEGTDEDIRYFIEIPELIDLWEELFLPAHVRLRWAAWLKKKQNIDLA